VNAKAELAKLKESLESKCQIVEIQKTKLKQQVIVME